MLTEERRCPTSATKKADLIIWLVQRGIAVPAGATRPELLLLCQQHRPEPQYVVDCLIREWRHEVVRLPPVQRAPEGILYRSAEATYIRLPRWH